MSTSAIRYSPLYTVEDHETWEGDWELWSGVAVCMSPSPTPLHQFIATSLAAEIRAQLKGNSGCDCIVITETDWCIDRSTVVRPDVSVLCHGLPAKYINYSPTLVAEVILPSTEHKDRTAKRELYQQQGVRWYLIVDPEKKAIECMELVQAGFTARTMDHGHISLALNANCGIHLDCDNIFGK